MKPTDTQKRVDGDNSPVDTGSAPLKENPVLSKIENFELPEENGEQLNPAMEESVYEKEAAEKPESLNRGFD
jgi:hypothetical protein